jgi:hypothetical protein
MSKIQRTKWNRRDVRKKNRDKGSSRDEYEDMRGMIRAQAKEIQRLVRQLRYFEKRDHLNELPEPDDTPEPIMVTEMRIPCTNPKEVNCNGFYDEKPLLDRVYGCCNTCGHYKRLK